MKKLIAICSFLVIVILAASCQNPQQIEYNRYYSAGAAVYQTHCQNCHGDRGQGLAALMPSLSDSEYLMRNIHQLPCYLKSGLKGKITVDKKEFDSQMPKTDLSPIEIAQVLTYVTNSFGNNNGMISSEAVEKDLKECK